MNGPFCLVVNPAAGGGRSLRAVPAVSAALAAAGARYEVTESASLDHARDVAGRAAGMGHVVVAVGGDGLVGALAGTAARAGAAFGIVPAGSGNDFARTLGLPLAAPGAARVLTGGRERAVDLIGVTAGDQPEVIVAGSVYLGLPSVAGEIANQMRWPRGSVRYPVAALRALAGWSPVTFRVRITGAAAGEFAGYAVVVANTAYFGAGMMVAPPAQFDDGALDVVAMRHASRLAFGRVLLRIRSGAHLRLPQVTTDRGAEVTVTADRELPAAADGETLPCAAPLRAGTPLRLRALPGALRALVPAEG